MQKDFIFASESASAGHPDKLCDQISDAIVDRFLEQDPKSAIRAECAVASAVLFIAARFSSKAIVDVSQVARKVIRKAGYVREDFNSKTCSILANLKELAPDESMQFDASRLTEEEIDHITVKQQSTIFGFACNQTKALMPLPIWLAHKLAMRIDAVRESGAPAYLAPDAKTQVSVEYRERRPWKIHNVSICTTLVNSGGAAPSAGKLKADILDAVIAPVFEDEEVRLDDGTKIFVNPEGVMMVGGPAMHSGLTGRKNSTDTYGEYSRYSGSAMSGKDPSRIDRVGVYAARYAAKNVVASGLADECEVQISYSIGLSHPVSVEVNTFDTGRLPDEKIALRIKECFDFRLAAIIREFDLRNLPARTKGGFYRKLAVYGQVGRTDLDLPWEKTDKASMLA